MSFLKKAFICSIDFITNEFIQEDGGVFDEMETLIVKDVWKELKTPKVGDYIYVRVYLGGEILY